ncbi:MAG: hypothetical protein M3Y08_01145 [Fibrobacterota bacterium]|nr:hypothetical protein [Fibrobacterota bacterium]
MTPDDLRAYARALAHKNHPTRAKRLDAAFAHKRLLKTYGPDGLAKMKKELDKGVWK